jgi:hypothetical protein
MQRIWKNAFLALPPRALITGVVDTARTLWNQALFDGEEALIPRKTITIMALLTIIGAVSVARRRGVPAALLLVIPFLVVGGASIARLWPMTPRLLVFLIPTVILLPVAGLSALSSRLPARARDAVFAVAVLLAMVPAGVVDVEKLRQPQRPDDSAPLIREFLAARKDGALMYVMGHAAPSWLFYTAPWDRRSGPVFQYAMARANTTAHPATRSCIQQERTQRTVFGGMGPVSFSDSSLAAEAAWVAAQPESEVWFLALAYETEPARRLDEQFVASGGTRTLDLARGGAQLRRYRFPPADSSGAKAHCEGEVAN